jgi:hypothetical protein
LQEARYVAGVQRFDFDRELAPYDLNRYSQWVSLSCHISEHVLEQLMPVSRQHCCPYPFPLLLLVLLAPHSAVLHKR